LERVFNDIEMNYQKQNIMEKIMTVSLSFRTHTHTLIQPHRHEKSYTRDRVEWRRQDWHNDNETPKWLALPKNTHIHAERII